MNELREQIDDLYALYDSIKMEIRRKDPQAYERWKAGGFLIDEDIVSMYPNLQTVSEGLEDTFDEDDDEDDLG